MKWTRFVGGVLVLWGLGALPAQSNWPMEPMQPDLEDLPSLQRGAALYMNYCLGCHSLQYQRYERTANDLGIPHAVFLENLIFTGQKIGGLMETSMPGEKSKAWFGAPPPDLTLVERVRGATWLYNYLKTFYIDETRPFGVNNKIFPNVGMPHVLMDLQGVQREVPDGFEPRNLLTGHIDYVPRSRLAVDEATGTYDEQAYDQAVYDLVNFLYYVGEPTRLERYRIGVYVLLFLVILFVFAYLLNREYWKDVH
ncbi:MAG: cytochrome c1 [Gammaproteobacteria bacterium]|nr:cytochrome c1 [Gammaproteobacteria bacterium]